MKNFNLERPTLNMKRGDEKNYQNTFDIHFARPLSSTIDWSEPVSHEQFKNVMERLPLLTGDFSLINWATKSISWMSLLKNDYLEDFFTYQPALLSYFNHNLVFESILKEWAQVCGKKEFESLPPYLEIMKRLNPNFNINTESFYQEDLDDATQHCIQKNDWNLLGFLVLYDKNKITYFFEHGAKPSALLSNIFKLVKSTEVFSGLVDNIDIFYKHDINKVPHDFSHLLNHPEIIDFIEILKEKKPEQMKAHEKEYLINTLKEKNCFEFDRWDNVEKTLTWKQLGLNSLMTYALKNYANSILKLAITDPKTNKKYKFKEMMLTYNIKPILAQIQKIEEKQLTTALFPSPTPFRPRF